jgi:muramoyltetrapeptide carboxypeptidase LdcA involved in peptidoglycan recycling
LIQQKDFSWVKWIVIWRFQKKAKITKKLLEKIIKTKKNLNNLPIIANADFWHTNPMFTFPIWWECEFKINGNDVNIKILKH